MVNIYQIFGKALLNLKVYESLLVNILTSFAKCARYMTLPVLETSLPM